MRVIVENGKVEEMTEEQYKEYKKKKDDLEPIKSFLFWCGGKGRKYPAFLKPRPRLFDLGIKYMFMGSENIPIPDDLREMIVRTIEEYVAEKERELEGI